MEAKYINGKAEGFLRRWYENGQLFLEANFVNDLEDSLHSSWHENGQLEFEANYANGKGEGIRSWDEDGQLILDEKIGKEEIQEHLPQTS